MAGMSPGCVFPFLTAILTIFAVIMSRYFSVAVVMCGEKVLKRIISSDLDKSAGELVSTVLEMTDTLNNVRVENIHASENNTDIGNIVESCTPLHVLVSFNLMHVTVTVSKEVVNVAVSSTSKSAYDILMSAAKPSFDQLPLKYALTDKDDDGTKLRGDHRLYNDLIDLFRDEGYGFTMQNISTVGKHVLKCLHNALWYITCQHEKLKERGIVVPDIFKKFSGYYDHKLSHKSPPKMEESKLRQHVDDLSEILMLPWCLKFQGAYKAVDSLMNGLRKYADFLGKQTVRSQERHSSSEPLRNPNFNFSLTPIDPTKEQLKAEYMRLDAAVSDAQVYEVVEMSEFLPESKYEKRLWLNGFQLNVPVAHYTYFQGNYLGNIHFIWRLPPVEDRADEKTLKAIQQIHKLLPRFATRHIRQDFFKRYQIATSAPKAVLRNLYKFLTDDCSAAESEAQSIIDQRVDEFLALGDADLSWDLRKLNGKPGSSKFDGFWNELDSYFCERDLAVHERRHGDHLYLPFAISVEDLVETIRKRLSPDIPIPSSEWVRLQFWPSNPNSRRALQHTGKFNIKFSLQTRQIRGQHEDAHFVATQLRYLKCFAVRHQDATDFFWLDDKAIVPIGEPGLPVSTGVRPHNASLAPRTGPFLSALDHDYNVCGAIPSVAFRCDIPSDASESFFTGTAFVTVKDKVFAASNAVRHGSETTNIIKSHFCGEDHVNAEKPVLIMYTDGGPDHRTTFGSVQLAAVAMFMWLNLDMLVTARTAPMGSWANLAERVNSVLNLALQNVALERETMTDELENKMKRIFSLKSARDTASRYPAFKEGLVKSVAPVLDLLKGRFSHLKLKGENIVINSAADDEAIDNFFQILKDVIDDSLDPKKLTKKDLEKSARLADFMQRHCRLRQYMFQIKKCARDCIDTCWYCSINPPVLPDEEFDNLHFVPDPMISPRDKDRFEEFETVFGKVTDDLARPSLSASCGASEHDKQNRKLLTANKVRGSIPCVECGKPRCIYADSKLTYAEKRAISTLKELDSYTCGSPLFSSTSKYFETVVVREGQRCSSTMETTYYASLTCSLVPVCFHCGISKSEDFADDADIQSLQTQYSVVRPICRSCKHEGKEAVVRGKRNVKKVRK